MAQQKEVQQQLNLLWLVILLVLSGATAVVMVWWTGGNVLLALMSPLGLTVSVLSCALGIIVGGWKLGKVKRWGLAGIWVVFLLPPLAISTLRIIDLTMFADVAVEQGQFNGTKTFHFGNFTSLIVEGGAVEYAFKHYNRSRGDMLHVPYDLLELQIDGHRRVVSDRPVGNQALVVDGKRYTVTAALRLGAEGEPSADERVRHPGIPSLIPE